MKKIVNEHESPIEVTAGMSAEYVSDAAEISRRKLAATAGDVKVRKNPRYGDNIENRIDGQSLLADQGRLLAPFRTTPMLISRKNQAHLFNS
jgi:hypothetical protein